MPATLSEKDDGSTADLAVGDTLRIHLSENASTGYRWAIDHFDERCIEALASEPRHDAQAPIGSAGEVIFDFRGRQAGSGAIVLKHWRHWEGESSVTRRFRVSLRIVQTPTKVQQS